MQLYIISQ